ncbi:MAG TPA: TSUP family transporter [Kofleriaceae bacterium]|nr:TSUP family transporter [Kofleriaceae bacterium]
MTWLLMIGLAAGVLTTVTGVGGGMVALSLLSLVMAPASALAISAAAFAVGNGHRVTLFARSVDRWVTMRFGLGLAVGAIAGAAVVPHVPDEALRLALAVVAAVSLARVAYQRWLARGASGASGVSGAARPAAGGASPSSVARLSASHLGLAGVVTGAIGAGAGGAGVLVAPLLLASGLRRDAYVGTVAACAIVLNGARVAGYAMGGLYSVSMVPAIGLLSGALVAGNLLGRWLRARMSVRLIDQVELAAPTGAIALALAGL